MKAYTFLICSHTASNWKMSNLYRPPSLAKRCSLPPLIATALITALARSYFVSATAVQLGGVRRNTHKTTKQAHLDSPPSGMRCKCTVYPCWRRTGARARPVGFIEALERCILHKPINGNAADWMHKNGTWINAPFSQLVRRLNLHSESSQRNDGNLTC